MLLVGPLLFPSCLRKRRSVNTTDRGGEPVDSRSGGAQVRNPEALGRRITRHAAEAVQNMACRVFCTEAQPCTLQLACLRSSARSSRYTVLWTCEKSSVAGLPPYPKAAKEKPPSATLVKATRRDLVQLARCPAFVKSPRVG